METRSKHLAAWAYEIQILGKLEKNWENWLNGDLQISNNDPSLTRITVTMPDQAALRGILNRLWDINATLIAVQRIDFPKQDQASPTGRKSSS